MTTPARTASRGSYRKGERKRQEIIEAALRTIAVSGFTNASIQQIADEVGITKAGVLHHFASREELLTEVLRSRDELDLAATRDMSRVDGLLWAVRHNADVPGIVALFAAMSSTVPDQPDSPSRIFFEGRYPTLIDGIAAMIARMQRTGDAPAHLDPTTCASLLVAAADGLQVQWLLDPSIDMAERLEYLWSTLVLGRPHAG